MQQQGQNDDIGADRVQRPDEPAIRDIVDNTLHAG